MSLDCNKGQRSSHRKPWFTFSMSQQPLEYSFCPTVLPSRNAGPCVISSYILRPRWTGDKPHMPLLWHKTAQQHSCSPDALRIRISVMGEIWLLWPHYKATPTSTEWVVKSLGLGAGEALTGHPCSLGVHLRTADRLEGTVVGNSHSSLSS